MEHNIAPARDNTGGCKGVAVSGVFEKHDLCPRQHRLVERQNKPLEPAAVFDRAAETSDVDGIGNMQRPAGKTAVDVWLDGVGQHQIRAKPLQDRAVLPQELCIARRVHAAPVDGQLDHTVSQRLQFIPPVIAGHCNGDLRVLLECSDQVFAKIIQPTAVVGQDQDLHGFVIPPYPVL